MAKELVTDLGGGGRGRCDFFKCWIALPPKAFYPGLLSSSPGAGLSTIPKICLPSFQFLGAPLQPWQAFYLSLKIPRNWNATMHAHTFSVFPFPPEVFLSPQKERGRSGEELC